MSGAEKLAVGMSWARRAALVVLLVGGAVALLSGLAPMSCSQQLPGGSPAPVTTCEPLGATDPLVLLYLLILGLLLLPELAELEVGGVLKVRREVQEARGVASDLRAEVASMRQEVLTAALSSAQSTSAATVNVMQGDRSADVDAAYSEAAGDGDGDFDEAERRGVHAAAAFESGFAGLTRYLEPPMTPAVVAGFVFGPDNKLSMKYLTSIDDEDGALESSLSSLPDVPEPFGTYVSVREHSCTYTAPAREDDGRVVGVLLVRIGIAAKDIDSLDETAAAIVEVMAGAYARLLIDVLDEEPRDSIPGVAAASEGES